MIASYETGLFAADDDYRVPDIVVSRAADRSQRGVDGTAELVVELRSPGDESYEKLPWYAARGVTEMLIVDPTTRRFELYRNDGGTAVAVAPDADGGVTLDTLGVRLLTVETERRTTAAGHHRRRLDRLLRRPPAIWGRSVADVDTDSPQMADDTDLPQMWGWGQVSKPTPRRSRARSQRPRRPVASSRTRARLVYWMTAQRSGSGGNGIGWRRTSVSSVRSVRRPRRRSRAARAPKRLAPTPRPVNPTAQPIRPPAAVCIVGVKRLVESTAPPQAWVTRDAVERRERVDEVAVEQGVDRVVALVALVDPAAEVVRRLPPTEQDPPVGGRPVVVELVAGVGDPDPLDASRSLATASSDSGSVTITWSYTGATNARRRRSSGGEAFVHNSTLPARTIGPVGERGVDAVAAAAQAGDVRVLGERAPR